MVIIDTALARQEEEGAPIRVGVIGTGYMGRAVVRQLLTPIRGIRLVAVANRNGAKARDVLASAGVAEPVAVTSAPALETAIAAGGVAFTDDGLLLCEAGNIDVIIDLTGEVEAGAAIALRAFEQGKHLVSINATLDATLGPILKTYADSAGVIMTNTEGDEPGVAMNLYRFVQNVGCQPVLAGNIKGFYDPYRTPATQRDFAEKTGQRPEMVTSFADGTKLSVEATLLANATGFGVGQRGMFGNRCAHVNEIVNHFSVEQLLAGGLVDFVLGAEPASGAFVVGYNEDPVKQKYMSYFKMGDGPLYVFYTPFHLPQLEVVNTIARAAIFRDAAVSPRGAPSCDVITIAKRDLKAGEVLDGGGGFLSYGVIENCAVSVPGELLPMGLSEGCTLRHDVAKDQAIGYADVVLPAGRLADRLRAEQVSRFWPAHSEAGAPRRTDAPDQIVV
jgi:predicted homoserine dehydrogenase-like protein